MTSPTTYFGELTFNRKVMEERLSSNTYNALIDCINKGAPLDNSIAAEVAHAMKEWAIKNRATHFTHWFQPQRGGTAEKHDAFLTFDSEGSVIERFSASQLIQSEPDASSFPSGGIRSTFEARGYTAWDPSTPAFLHEADNSRTLVIPSVFLSWTGAVLDIKTPYLRSIKALNDVAMKLQRMLGNRLAKRITVFAGPEQEYFLFSKELFSRRDDLKVTGRTLFGAAPAKGQQMEDHYFGAIKPKVLKFMEDLDKELFRRGIPAKTRHNEVAPNQFEIACIYEEANLAIDHNLQLLDILKNTAEKHSMVAITHEKPMKGVNGSGKHLNWSIGDNTGANYLEPSRSPLKNISFLMTIGAVLLGVSKYHPLLRASVADAGNDCRLGAHEAPPAIISVYLGKYLNSLLDEIEGIGKLTQKKMASINLGVQNLPKVSKDTSDRNRTSPLAFTGNKFEFRAVGASHNCAEAAMILNLCVAYGYQEIIKMLNARKGGAVKQNAILVLRDILKKCRNIVFEGDNYSEEWKKEAIKRKLSNDKNTPQALKQYLTQEAIQLFDNFNIFSKLEIKSRVDIKIETYIKVKEIELKTAVNIVKTQIIPAVNRQYRDFADSVKTAKAAGIKYPAPEANLKETDTTYRHILDNLKIMETFLNKIQAETDLFQRAAFFAEKGEALLCKLRDAVDKAELIVDNHYWPMTKYQQLLNEL